MKLNQIITSIRTKLDKTYEIKYEEKFEQFTEMFLSPTEFRKVKIRRIMIIVDKRPHSLVTISYGIYLASIFNTSLYAITEGIHSRMIKEEAENLEIKINFKEVPENDLEEVRNYIAEVKPSLIVINHTHRLREHLQNTSHLPIFVTKASQFFDI